MEGRGWMKNLLHHLQTLGNCAPPFVNIL
ncbi:hypothetical protein A2U01_0085248, partial [Trifolium medium]|nr:hypothetical protein [Trifolium medium]